MAAESKVTTVVPLNRNNYSTWKVQCKMALMRDSLWSIIAKQETAPVDITSREYATFMTRYNKALATIVLTLDPNLLYILGEPDDPVFVWEKLAEQFQKKSWVNKLILRRKLYSLQLKEGDSVQEHIKAMTEVFNELTVIGVEMGEEDHVIYLLASLPKMYSTLVTALEARPEAPAMDIVEEKLLYEERKLQDRRGSKETCPKGLSAKHRSLKEPRCHFCHKFGHIQCNCMEKMQGEKKADHEGKKKTFKHRAHHTQRRQCDSDESDSNAVGLVTSHVLSVGTLGDSEDAWIVDSGATCHISNNRKLFTEYHTLQKPLEVSLGDW